MQMPSRLRDVDDPGLQAVFKELAKRKAAGKKPSNRKELAAALEVSKQAISSWPRVPVERVLEIEALLGVPREIMREDVYGATPKRRIHIKSRGARSGRKHG
jgi:hypothetical protein